ncbi:MAG: 23S rRNA (adenine(2030)-N(6))-methyltransferase RlmJ [Rhodocyclaceae bacterium]|nr:23S rRNA (adenine(2030)-N(6))-methyltransferase RlmJ [Rhodocyclaceae bacterium]
MLSYRHAYHAGNHADVLKHLLLVHTLEYFNHKAAPYWYIDTHAGPGSYALNHGLAAQHGESDSGIARIRAARDLPPAVSRYAEVVNSGGEAQYPGSPDIAYRLTRREDALRLFELHPADARALAEHFADAGRRVKVAASDGFAALKALLPPPTRRAVVLIDPPYELKQDYGVLVDALALALKRFATGCYLVWYPLLARPEARRLPAELTRVAAAAGAWLHVRLHVAAPAADGLGMTGSGMFVFNPPWTLRPSLEECLPWLVRTLGQDASARFDIEGHQP